MNRMDIEINQKAKMDIEMNQMDILKQRIRVKDMTSQFRSFLNQSQSDIDVPIICSLGLRRVDIPVRHSLKTNNCCLFELENICEFILSNTQVNEQIQCPACRSYVQITDFGVDRLFYHILSQMNFQNLEDERYQKKKIRYTITQRKFYAIHAVGNNQTEILGINYKQPDPPTDRQEILKLQLKTKLNSIQNILINRVQNCKLAAQSIGLSNPAMNLIKIKALQASREISQLINAKMGLKQVGRQSLLDSDEFCFGLFKRIPTITNTKSFVQPVANQSSLITYHPRQNIWHDYLLQLSDGTDFIYNEAALGLKSRYLSDCNQVFLLGGLNKKQQISLTDFYEIRLPKKATNEYSATTIVKKLPDLPQKYCLPMGVHDEGKIYLLGGALYNSAENIQMNSDVYVFENGKWSGSKLQLPNPRIDGTIHFDRTSKKVALIGGYKINPKRQKQLDKDQEQVTKIDVLSLKDFTVQTWDLNFGLIDSKILINRCLIARLDAQDQEILIFNGKNLGQNLNLPNFKPQVVNMVYRNAQRETFLNLNTEFSSQSVYVLDRAGCNAIHQMNDCQFQTLIHDYEGIVMDDVYNTIYNRPDNFQNMYAQQKLQICVYKYDLATGNNKFIGFQHSKQSIDRANQAIQNCQNNQSTLRSFSQMN